MTLTTQALIEALGFHALQIELVRGYLMAGLALSDLSNNEALSSISDLHDAITALDKAILKMSKAR